MLYFLNPAPPPELSGITNTRYAGIQLILPGEIARTHHHTPSAIRFVIEGEQGYTTVSGERSVMQKGDFLTTPAWTWHDHGNAGDRPVMWLDRLDIPLISQLNAVFDEELTDDTGSDVQPVSKPSARSMESSSSTSTRTRVAPRCPR